ncbi:MazG family protein [Hoyosella rhizosphaerae]|uniref:Transcriptional regulator, MazG family protein n=1 Tax=Hoyosella rhizosphaerae TaxID=1755582 RepID=A0A916XF03_9ACTN|nr:MazG family protein [Hoyosella rhizosphaerae]MBN4925722.1 MazG family protein [Hoyosella rhizosphaerae]GGC68460.1 putative transcriptional regulator, MazG family protein [Hoyosella rhizosphaerae]
MTIVVLDPRRPHLIPVEALPHLLRGAHISADVPDDVARHLTDGGDTAPTLVTTNAHSQEVAVRQERGEPIITTPPFVGRDVLIAIDLLDTLRTHGPWEAEQTHISLLRYLLEETYELLDAAHSGDLGELRGELGDLLLQVLFHARIAEDHSDQPFNIDDVADALVTKLNHRNPPDFVDPAKAIDADEQNRRWEQRKAAEKRRDSILDGIPLNQPALSLAEKVLTRAEAAQFPNDLVPSAMQQITITPGGGAEIELRNHTLRFMNAIRAAETQNATPPTSPEEWRTRWPTASAQTTSQS